MLKKLSLQNALLIALLLTFVLKPQAQNLQVLSDRLDSLVELQSDKIIDEAKNLEKFAKKENAENYLAKAYSILAKTYYQKKSYNKSIKYFDKELAIREKSPKNSDLLESYYNLGSTCLKLKKNKKAIIYFEKSLKKAHQLNNKDFIRANQNALVISSEAIGDYKKSALYLKQLLAATEGVFNSKINLYKKEVVKQKHLITATHKELNKTKKKLDTATTELIVSEELIDFLEEDTLKKQQEIASLNFQKMLKQYRYEIKDEELKFQKKLTYILIFGLLIISGLAVIVFFLLQSKKKLNKELIEQNHRIEIQNKAITSSIHYASKIQTAILPKNQLFNNYFDEHLILYKPRDVVSGDFYFLQKVNQYLVFSVVDCTGHGVPGAFLSMLGSAYLNEIIRQKEVKHAGQILDLLREQVKSLLQQTGEKGEQKDGMDMALCVFDTESYNLQYAGAYNPLIIVRNGELIEYKGDRMPIAISRKEKTFTNHIIKMQKNDQIYLFSDGFADQIGGEKTKKYMTKKFKTFLLDNSSLTMNNQFERLYNEFETWKSQQKQIDDVTVMAVKIK